MKPLPPSLQRYVNFIAAAGRPVGLSEVIALTPGRNYLRCLQGRGLVRNVVEPYEKGDKYTGPRLPKYVLTEEGERRVTKGKV